MCLLDIYAFTFLMIRCIAIAFGSKKSRERSVESICTDFTFEAERHQRNSRNFNGFFWGGGAGGHHLPMQPQPTVEKWLKMELLDLILQVYMH